jgi:hypothetical protein
MRPEGDHKIQLLCIVEELHKGSKKKRHGQGAGMIGDHDQDPLIMKNISEAGMQRLNDFFRGKSLAPGRNSL